MITLLIPKGDEVAARPFDSVADLHPFMNSISYTNRKPLGSYHMFYWTDVSSGVTQRYTAIVEDEATAVELAQLLGLPTPFDTPLVTFKLSALPEGANPNYDTQPDIVDTELDLTTPQGVKGLLVKARDEKHWGDLVDEVKRACGGYPDWWFKEIVMSGFANTVTKGF